MNASPLSSRRAASPRSSGRVIPAMSETTSPVQKELRLIKEQLNKLSRESSDEDTRASVARFSVRLTTLESQGNVREDHANFLREVRDFLRGRNQPPVPQTDFHGAHPIPSPPVRQVPITLLNATTSATASSGAGEQVLSKEAATAKLERQLEGKETLDQQWPVIKQILAKDKDGLRVMDMNEDEVVTTKLLTLGRVKNYIISKYMDDTL